MTGNTKSVFSYLALNDPSTFDFVICHEIAHCLNLLHIFQGHNTPECEHVTRNPSDPNYNATTAGDFVADTPAQSQVSWSQFTGCNYNYNAANTDCQGTPYQGIIKSNLMGYLVDPSPCFHLTAGQVTRMKQYLESPGFSHYTQTYNDVASLYEPYDELLMVGNQIVSTQEAPGGNGLMVCRNYVFRRSYQKGFTYHFYNTEPSSPTHVDINTTFVYNDRPDHAIKVVIDQVNPTAQVSSSTVSTTTPYSCTIEPYVSGRIYSMEVLGAMNVTVTELDAIQVNNPELYEQMMTQYYNILKKTTESGITKESIIYRN
ncbi:M43 family zinc metalloprotease [Flavobacterium sp.]|uniref:M43 family zinc metalloprotease n=1 Tax=Flavobacterium sp. TaxID=239 RepID=UPI0039E2AFD6